MRCPKCHRELSEREPVYQVRRATPPYPGIVHVCRKCWEERKSFTRYEEPKLCDSCERPVINKTRRYGWSIIACSPDCRKRIENARYRAKRSQHPADRPCVICDEPFTPKRSDALYCSPACKQKAYRQRSQEALWNSET
jgi:hypothetical protein